MRILTWCDTFWPVVGGAEVIARTLNESLVARGHQSAVVTSMPRPIRAERERVGGIDIFRLPMFEAFQSRNAAAILECRSRAARFVREFHPDVWHFQGIGATSLIGLGVASAGGVPALTTIHHTLTSDSGGVDTLKQQVITRSQRVVAVSKRATESAGRLFALSGDRIRTIYNGLPEPPITPRPRVADPPHLVCLARLAESKGLDMLLHAMERLVPRYPAIHLTIGGSGPLADQLQQMAKDLALADRVVFTGNLERDGVWSLLDRATMLVLPSRPWREWQEGLPTVLIEAALMARPTVAARTGGVVEAMIGDRTGLMHEPGDVDGLVACVTRLLDDTQLADAMGMAGREFASSTFALERMVRQYESCYEELVAAVKPVGDQRGPAS